MILAEPFVSVGRALSIKCTAFAKNCLLVLSALLSLFLKCNK